MVVSWPSFGGSEVVCHGQARDSSPAVTNLEKFQRIDKGLHLLLAEFATKHNREDTCGASKITLPNFVSGAGWEGRVQNELDLGLHGEPPCEVKRALADRLHSESQSFHAT